MKMLIYNEDNDDKYYPNYDEYYQNDAKYHQNDDKYYPNDDDQPFPAEHGEG